MMSCPLCQSPLSPFAKALVLKKYQVNYYRCDGCGFVQTEPPYWLPEAYSEAINRNDIGLVGRNLRLAKATRAIISSFFDGNGKFVDYGGGYGLFVRLMRDAGFDFYRHDKYCANLFAPDFEADPTSGQQYELLCAFEVFEHLADPLEEIDRMLSHSDNILFTTEILPPGPPQPDQWWYYIPDYGQHISFYTMDALSKIAQRFGLHLCSDGRSLHLFSRRRISPLLFKAVSRQLVAAVVNLILRRTSRLADDFQEIAKAGPTRLHD
ncbi:class I SAM-dependent methyltransferase [Geomesophilobacter sediminis]|uniref:Class I SAM-dependent methyltransferase n=1 Tax=Geomesophilobacter sediminis TaxID=2798584 RepID=A0A8J7M1Z8_9BACT|nr:class I SAM-dependent methyltransferase [Geomesophilobacter sediminis]MBJ6727029.1 class I SAM-dependent methyltransferase [Geomesophilobacter sediminis]